MNFRFITQDIHAYLDYPVALSLVVLPVLLGLGESDPLAMWLSVVTGMAAFGLTLLTDHRTGVLPVVPYSIHLAVDAAVGVAFLAAPFVFGFSGLDRIYYLANGAAVMAVVSLHKPSPSVATQSAKRFACRIGSKQPTNIWLTTTDSRPWLLLCVVPRLAALTTPFGVYLGPAAPSLIELIT